MSLKKEMISFVKRRKLPGDAGQLKEFVMGTSFFGAGSVHKKNKVIIRAIDGYFFDIAGAT
ncbi:MAG: hypothetical protein ACL93V_11755 [Candidatus Electrothrix sp. YB6]